MLIAEKREFGPWKQLPFPSARKKITKQNACSYMGVIMTVRYDTERAVAMDLYRCEDTRDICNHIQDTQLLWFEVVYV